MSTRSTRTLSTYTEQLCDVNSKILFRKGVFERNVKNYQPSKLLFFTGGAELQLSIMRTRSDPVQQLEINFGESNENISDKESYQVASVKFEKF